MSGNYRSPTNANSILRQMRRWSPVIGIVGLLVSVGVQANRHQDLVVMMKRCWSALPETEAGRSK